MSREKKVIDSIILVVQGELNYCKLVIGKSVPLMEELYPCNTKVKLDLFSRMQFSSERKSVLSCKPGEHCDLSDKWKRLLTAILLFRKETPILLLKRNTQCVTL